MRGSRRKKLFVLLLSALLLLLSGAAMGQSQKVIEKVSDQDIIMLLKQNGYQYEQLKTGVFRLKIMDLSVLLFRKDTNLQLYAGFSKKLPCDKLNEWNKKKRFSRAYLDKDGDAVIESDMDLEGGSTTKAIKVFIETFKISLASFVSHIK